jgi:peptidoglycan hydrolase-like protein with peptidoglycan-binding domain
MHPGQIRAYQALLTSLGFPVKLTNQLDSQTADAVATYQQRAHLPVTGVIDVATRAMLLTPFSPPIHAH